MGLQLTAATLDLICQMAVGTTFANASPANQLLILGDTNALNAPTSTPGGLCGLAFNMVNPYAVALGFTTDSGSPPSAWVTWFVVETVALFMDSSKPDQSPVWRSRRAAVMNAALDAIPALPADTALVQASGFTVQALRGYVLGHTGRLRRKVLPSIAEIDAHIQAAISELWKGANWSFRRRAALMTIDEDGVTFDVDDALEISGSATATWRFASSDGRTCGDILRYASGDQFSRAVAAAPTATGKPQLFRIDPLATGAEWRVYPLPASGESFTLYGEVYVDTPAMPTSATDPGALTAFPRDFWPVLRDLVLSRVLRALGADDQRLSDDVQDQIRTLLPQYQDIGTPDDRQSMQDLINDPYAAGDPDGIGGRM